MSRKIYRINKKDRKTPTMPRRSRTEAAADYVFTIPLFLMGITLVVVAFLFFIDHYTTAAIVMGSIGVLALALGSRFMVLSMKDTKRRKNAHRRVCRTKKRS